MLSFYHSGKSSYFQNPKIFGKTQFFVVLRIKYGSKMSKEKNFKIIKIVQNYAVLSHFKNQNKFSKNLTSLRLENEIWAWNSKTKNFQKRKLCCPSRIHQKFHIFKIQKIFEKLNFFQFWEWNVDPKFKNREFSKNENVVNWVILLESSKNFTFWKSRKLFEKQFSEFWEWIGNPKFKIRNFQKVKIVSDCAILL